METIYIFSEIPFKVLYKEKLFYIGFESYLEITNYDKDDYVTILDFYNNQKNVFLHNIKKQSGISIYKNNDKYFVNIKYLQPQSPTKIFNINNGSVTFFSTYVTILYNEICYEHNFNYSDDCFCIENENKIFLFNNTHFLEFEKKYCTFNKKLIKELKKDQQITEVLTKIPFNENLLTIYKFELEKGEISLKNLKNNKFFKKNQHFMPFSIFHLLKNDFTKQIDFYESDKLESLKQYFLNYNIIKKFNENFYMINNFEIQKINLKFDDNRIVDID